MTKWLESSSEMPREVYEEKLEKLESILGPMMQKLHDVAGGPSTRFRNDTQTFGRMF
jgi:hypothetical protein